MLDSVIRANKKYYPQTLLEMCKYEIIKNKMENLRLCFNNNNKTLIVCINYALLDFYLCYSRWYNSV